MRKDIFIDNNIAKNFNNPSDSEYKKLSKWLLNACYSENPSKNAYLMVSNKLIYEYTATAGASNSATSIIAIIQKMTREGRLVRITPKEIKEFKRKYFKKHIVRRLRCNEEDRDHLPVVLLSERKYALSLDDKFINDLRIFSGFVVVAEKKPQDIRYDK